MKTRNSFNNKVVDRSYKNTSSTESVNIRGIRPPFRVIDGNIVHASHDGHKWVWS